MKHFFLILFGALLLCSCQDRGIESELTPSPCQKQEDNNNAFLVFSSREELAEAISNLRSGKHYDATRASNMSTVNNDKVNNGGSGTMQFLSLPNANKQKYMARLTQAQIDSINTDEDSLEFCMSDSIIADDNFAQLLNVTREIEVDDTVYKYYGNGIAFSEHSKAKQLNDIDAEVAKITVDDNNIGKTLSINKDVRFIPYNYTATEETDDNTGTRAYTNNEALQLKIGVTITANNIRDVDYNSKGDGGWLHRAWSRLWGRNVLAINQFNGHRRLRLGLYDQNYYVYANIGTTMKMQKKRCGIWWNCKADEIRVGWSAIELKYTFPSPVIQYLNPNVNPKQAVETDYPSWLKHNFPFKNENSVLFHVPFTSYNVTVKNVNSLLKSGIKSLLNNGAKSLRDYINSTPESQRGLYSVDNSALYVITGADEDGKKNIRTFTRNFYEKWFPGNYAVGISYNGNWNLKNISIDGGKSTKLSSCVVYGAVKYNGRWLAARITKSKDQVR